MSSLLKEAIVDAKALKEAALKNAEASIIEKYSSEVKNALTKLLEQDELEMDLGGEVGAPAEADPLAAEDPAAGMGAEEAPEDIGGEDIPLGATDVLANQDGQMPSNIPASGQKVEFNVDLDTLQEAIKALSTEMDDQEEFIIEEKDLYNILAEDDAGSFAGEEAEDDDSEEDSGTALAGSAAAEEADSDAMKNAGLEEDLDIDALTDAIAERLTVDMGATLSGWAGRSSESQKWEMEKALAHRRSTDMQDELEVLKKAQEELVFENKQLKEQNNQYKQATTELKESLQDVNLSNARLLYTNRVLRNTSLNERQKTKIVEAISSAGSVTEARTIFDTLQSTTEAKPTRSPQSLSEAITRRSSVIRASRHAEKPSSDPLQDRMKRLAGIK